MLRIGKTLVPDELRKLEEWASEVPRKEKMERDSEDSDEEDV